MNLILSITMASLLFATYNMVTPPKGVLQDPTSFELTDYNPLSELYIPISLSKLKQEGLTEDEIESISEEEPTFFEPKKSYEIYTQLKGPKLFEEAFSKALAIDPSIAKYKTFLIRTAKRESGFNSRILNKSGAPYYGYFQMGKNEIKNTTGLTVEQFRNDPVRQILGAVNLYKINLRTIKSLGVYELGKEKGYSDDALVSGAWLAGAGGVKKFLLGKGNPSDSHWYKDKKGGVSVKLIMDNWMKGKK